MKKVLLYSGGMDSWLIDYLWKPDLRLYVDMKTRYSDMELHRLRQNKVDMKVVDFPLGQYEREDAIIPLRNLYLVMVACNETLSEDVEICLGATHGDRSLDQSIQFTEYTNNLLNYLYGAQHWIPDGKKINVCMKYKDFTKAELLTEYLNNGGDIQVAFQQSLSCYNPKDDAECWNCKPCFRKFVAFLLNGWKFNLEISTRMLHYIEDNVEPDILSGNYGRGKEEAEILEALRILREDNQ